MKYVFTLAIFIIISYSIKAQVNQKITGLSAAVKFDNDKYNLAGAPHGYATGIFFDMQFSKRFHFNTALQYNNFKGEYNIWCPVGYEYHYPLTSYRKYQYFELPVNLLVSIVQSEDQDFKLLLGGGFAPAYLANTVSGTTYRDNPETNWNYKGNNGFYFGLNGMMEARFNILKNYTFSIGADATLTEIWDYAPFSGVLKFGRRF